MRQIPKIAYLLTSLGGGGSERNILNLCLFDKKKICKPEVITFTSQYDFFDEYTKKDRSQIQIHHLLERQKKIPKYSVGLFCILFYRLFLLIKKQKYAVLLGAVEIYPYYITVFYSILCNTKSILIVGNNLSEELKTTYSFSKLIHKIFLCLAFRITSKVICVSFGVKEDLVKNFFVPRKKIIVITNGIDRQKIVSLSQKKGRVILKKKDYLVAFGRLFPKKGYRALLKVFYLVLQTYPNLYLVIIGKGPLEKNLKEYTKVLDIEKNVQFLGFEKKNPYRILAKAKLFLFTSLHEGFGNVIIEAMACATPIISTNCLYGPLEIIHNATNYISKRKDTIYGKYGVLTPVFSFGKSREASTYEEKEMAKAVCTLLGNSKLRQKYSELSKKRSEDFTVQKMVDQYNIVIRRLL